MRCEAARDAACASLRRIIFAAISAGQVHRKFSKRKRHKDSSFAWAIRGGMPRLCVITSPDTLETPCGPTREEYLEIEDMQQRQDSTKAGVQLAAPQSDAACIIASVLSTVVFYCWFSPGRLEEPGEDGHLRQGYSKVS